AGLALHLAAEEQLESRIERVPAHRVLGTEQLRGEAESGADEAPRCRRLAEHAVPIVGFELDDDAREILGGRLRVIDIAAHLLRELLRIPGTRPLEARDVTGDTD